MARLPPLPQGGGLQLAVAARVGVEDGKQDLYGALLATIAVASVPALRSRLRASLRSLKDQAAAGERSEALSAGGAGAFVDALSLPAEKALREALAAKDAERASRDVALAAAQTRREDVPAKLFKNRAASLLSLEGELKVALSWGEDMCARLMEAVEGLGGSSDVAKRVDMQVLKRDFTAAAEVTAAQYDRWKLWDSRVPKPNGDAVLIELWMLCTAAQRCVQDFERAASAFLLDAPPQKRARKRKQSTSRPAGVGADGSGGGGRGGSGVGEDGSGGGGGGSLSGSAGEKRGGSHLDDDSEAEFDKAAQQARRRALKAARKAKREEAAARALQSDEGAPKRKRRK